MPINSLGSLSFPRLQALPMSFPHDTSPPVKIPDPPPSPPPGLDTKMDVLLSWGKWGVVICGLAGLLICAGQMAIGRKNRSAFAADGATGVPWALGGLSLAATAAPIVGVFFK
ncbi:hypothetical protein [Actinomadura xylanilytica]|uniref:hypothetical protein n=1 Tax=Actinomadura xylanilytica TaxID=887459 RepID=UPI00255AD43E|nr:hypothetical protein [Actinomadura xylanilytica]MDL4770739.1 hypothetical protein [Actinomadura xylanilytica]